MSDILDRILAVKAREIEAARGARALATVRAEAERAGPPRGFAAALRARIAAGGAAVIAEVKKASPSKGVLRAEFDPAAIARAYAANGAACLSVLTDRQFFQGAPELPGRGPRPPARCPSCERTSSSIRYQVYEARAMGADCILLIVAALDQARMRELETAARALGHGCAGRGARRRGARPSAGAPHAADRASITATSAPSRRGSRPRSRCCPGSRRTGSSSRRAASSSGTTWRACARDGVNAFLVGEAFMRAPDPGAVLAELFPA